MKVCLLDIIVLLKITTVNNLVNLMYGKYLAPVSPFSISSFMAEIDTSLWHSFSLSLDVISLSPLAPISDGSELEFKMKPVDYLGVYTFSLL